MVERHGHPIALDTPEDSPESDLEAPYAKRPIVMTTQPYPSPPPSPLYPSGEPTEQLLVASPVDESAPPNTSKPLPPTEVMQGYVVPPAEPPAMRLSYPPASTTSRALPLPPLPASTPSRHYSAPLALQTPAYLIPELQNDIFALTESGPYPSTRPRRPLIDPEPPLVSYAAAPGSPQPPDPTRAMVQRVSGPQVPAAAAAAAAAIPLSSDVCVECMMRDRDMADVDVRSPGSWDRASDVDYLDALRAEEAELVRRRESTNSSRINGNASGSEGDHGGSRWSLGQPAGGGTSSRESASVEHSGKLKSRRVGKGQELTQASLKLWTSMKPPASSHRWRTLQLYLREQNKLLALEQAEQLAIDLERDRFDVALRERSGETLSLGRPPLRNRGSTVLPSGITVERVDVHKDEKELRSRTKGQHRQRGRRLSSGNASHPPQSRSANYPYLLTSELTAASSASLDSRVPPSPDSAVGYRLPSPALDAASSTQGFPLYARSSADLRSTSPYGARPASLAPSERPRSFMRGLRSASASALSLAPSGSMIDMHVGLEQDRHLDLENNRQISDDELIQTTSTQSKRRTLGKIFSKLNLRSAPTSPPSMPLHMPSPRTSISLLAASPVDEGPLDPPFPSYLAGDPALLHRRSPTTSTLSSQPATPELNPHTSLTSHLPLRKEKSLPALPPDDDLLLGETTVRSAIPMYERHASAPAPETPGARPMPSSDSTEHIGGGRKAKASHVSSRRFVFAPWRRRAAREPEDFSDNEGAESPLNEKARFDFGSPRQAPLDAVVRDVHFIATRYPSLN